MTLAAGASLAVVPAAALAKPSSTSSTSTTSTSTACTAPAVAQVYSWAQDTNWYAPLSGEKWDSLGSGSGWTLSGGAKLETVTLYDGTKGSVLDLPSGSEAITPPMCVTNDYPSSRAEVRDVSGSAGVNVYVSYMGASKWNSEAFSANLDGFATSWSLPKSFNIIRSNVSSWQLARFVLVPQGTSSEYQISNFYVDPRMHK